MGLVDVCIYYTEVGGIGHSARNFFKEISSVISQIHEVWLKLYTPEGFPVLWLTWLGTLAVCDRYTTTTGMSHREEINSSLMNKNSLERHLSN